jgi:hypothetical protein
MLYKLQFPENEYASTIGVLFVKQKVRAVRPALFVYRND